MDLIIPILFRLDDYRDEDGQLRLSLVNPEEPPRDGKPRAIKTDKTRSERRMLLHAAELK